VKIISRGVKPEDKVYKGTCMNCMTVFECQRHEGTFHEARDQRDDSYLSVKCPVCGKSANAYLKRGGDLVPSDMRHAWSGIGGDGRI
jgi:hypothetical protein